jgi:hypothetical protein
MPQVTEIVANGQVIVRDMTEAELAEYAELQARPAPVPVLNRAQWGYLLDSTRFRITLDAFLAGMPQSTEQERRAWARLKNVASGSDTYSQSNTLAILANLRANGVSGLPSDQEIIDAWADAAQFDGVASIAGAV